MREEAFCFGPGNRMVGVASFPDGPTTGPAFVFPNAGLIHRVGPNRLYVRLARDLARLGHLSFRFDLQGLGDSQANDSEELTPPGWRDYVEQSHEAIRFLSRSMGCERFAVLGVCSGGEAAFHVARQDPRVVGAGLLNPLGGATNEDLVPILGAQAARRYYLRGALTSWAAWKRFLTGKTRYRRLLQTWLRRRPVTPALPEQTPEVMETLRANLNAILARGTRLLVVYTEWGQESDLVRLLRVDGSSGVTGRDRLSVHMVANCDHTFTPLRCQANLLALVRDWAAEGWALAT